MKDFDFYIYTREGLSIHMNVDGVTKTFGASETFPKIDDYLSAHANWVLLRTQLGMEE